MYKVFIANSRAKKNLKKYLRLRKDISDKLDRLKINPRAVLDAHPLHGILSGKWSCWLGANVRMIYRIDDVNKIIIIEAVGTHKIY